MAWNFHFEPVTDDHLLLLFEWLSQPFVSKWWGDPKEELELIRNGRRSGEAHGYVVFTDNNPVGYIQSWRPSDFSDEDWHAEQPEGTLGVDVFIGNNTDTGKGIGPAMIRQFCGRLLDEDAKRIIIDPDPENEYAVRAYLKTGFTPLKEYKTPSGTILLMELDLENFGKNA